MNTLAIIIICFLFFASPAAAYDAWTKTDLALEGAAIGLMAADWAQTRTVSRNPDKYHETNPILGDHPSTDTVDRYFAASILGHVAVAHCIPARWRQWWAGAFIAIEGATVGHNNSIGVGMRF